MNRGKMKGVIRRNYRIWRMSLEWFFVNSFLSGFPSRRIRMGFLRLLGAEIGKVSMFGGFEIRNLSDLKICDGSSIGPRVLLDARKGLVIEKNVTIACEVMIWTLHHDYNSSSFRTVGEKVVIKEYAWVCSRSIILPGVIIGKGAVVASGSVVTKDVPDYMIVGGVPAKIIGERENKSFNYIPYYELHIV